MEAGGVVADERVTGVRVVHGVIECGHRASRIAKGRMGGDVVDAFAVDLHLAAVAQGLEIALPGEQAIRHRGHAPIDTLSPSKWGMSGRRGRDSERAISTGILAHRVM